MSRLLSAERKPLDIRHGVSSKDSLNVAKTSSHTYSKQGSSSLSISPSHPLPLFLSLSLPYFSPSLPPSLSPISLLQVSELVSPKKLTAFQQQLLLAQEAAYASRNKTPLGRSHDQRTGLPAGLCPINTTFGTPVVKGDTAGELVSPAKSALQVEEEAQDGKELYIRSHGKYDVGEMVDRKYDWSTFTRGSLYGVPTPHDNSGSGARNSLHWLTLAQQ